MEQKRPEKHINYLNAHANLFLKQKTQGRLMTEIKTKKSAMTR